MQQGLAPSEVLGGGLVSAGSSVGCAPAHQCRCNTGRTRLSTFEDAAHGVFLTIQTEQEPVINRQKRMTGNLA